MHKLVKLGSGALAFTAFFALCLVAIYFVTPGRAWGHDIYSQWTQPANGASCCNGKDKPHGDCEITRAYWDGSKWMALFDGGYVAIPPHAILDTTKLKDFDGNAHLCAKKFGSPGEHVIIFCFAPPEARS